MVEKIAWQAGSVAAVAAEASSHKSLQEILVESAVRADWDFPVSWSSIFDGALVGALVLVVASALFAVLVNVAVQSELIFGFLAKHDKLCVPFVYLRADPGSS
jgi:cadmium resistance protein CadD (predicted permease)